MTEGNKILVVDDDKNICELVRLYLKKEGYDVSKNYTSLNHHSMVYV